MNLNKVKELEDLKEELSSLYSKRNKRFEESKKSFLSQSKEEFKSFFVNKGFEIETSTKTDNDGTKNEVIKANYKGFRVEIAVPPSEVSYMGVSSVMVLNVSQGQKEYRLWVNEVGEEPGIKFTVTSSIDKRELAEGEKIDTQIKEVRNNIENVKNIIGASDPKFNIQIRINENQMLDHNKFESLYNLLEYMFNE